METCKEQNLCEKFDTINNEASDVASLGHAVADLFAQKGTNNDDLAMSTVMNTKVTGRLWGTKWRVRFVRRGKSTSTL